jgi:hypothetical protein
MGKGEGGEIDNDIDINCKQRGERDKNTEEERRNEDGKCAE